MVSTEDEDAAMLLMLVSVYAKYKQSLRRRTYSRRWWIRPINMQRERIGYYANLCTFMKQHDEEQFLKLTRMSILQFQELLALVAPKLAKIRTRETVCPEERLLITI